MPLPFVSLIPKKEEKFNLAKILSILFYISIFLVLVSLGLLFFFDNSVKKANKNLGDLEQTFTSQKSPEFLKLEQDVLDSKQKIRDFETISAQHRFTLNIFTALEKSGYEVKTKDLQIFPGGAKKGDWDVGITMDMVQTMSKLDVLIIVSGDGDYVDAVNFLKAHGNRVEALAFGRSTSAKLKEAVDDFIDLDESPRKYLFPMRR